MREPDADASCVLARSLLSSGSVLGQPVRTLAVRLCASTTRDLAPAAAVVGDERLKPPLVTFQSASPMVLQLVQGGSPDSCRAVPCRAVPLTLRTMLPAP